MAKSPMFSIYDSAAGAYLPPSVVPSVGLFERICSIAANDPNHDFCKFPHQYNAMLIAYFDSEVGSIEPIMPQSLGTVTSIAKRLVAAQALLSEEKN